jgi:sRNA-binding regulator protein Hfq
MTEESKTKPDPDDKKKAQMPVFLPKLLDKRVAVKILDGKQISGTIKGFNAYEIRLRLMNGTEWLLFKHAIIAIAYPESYMNEKE